jgi:hypothetical protein
MTRAPGDFRDGLDHAIRVAAVDRPTRYRVRCGRVFPPRQRPPRSSGAPEEIRSDVSDPGGAVRGKVGGPPRSPFPIDHTSFQETP